ncbi:WD repeat-containing protein 25 isoform X2 [Phyllopteryx taeniolatus]|uniref:WD repeat-containing protein 25 isoform X2 n=1 Tax=Phyllopteryx taeniolatus TaxID=161469 RepID=UPI002AD53084|nr:WD repeat-containing protein 25 isoform X2 [Phyllopteryx taeniolatus]
MTTLVAYEDSESEDECLDQKKGAGSQHEGRECHLLASRPDSTMLECHLNVFGKDSSSSQKQSSSLGTPAILQKKAILLPYIAPSVSDKPKRPCTVPPGVRPYIPKRQRLVTSSIEKEDNLTGGVHYRDFQILSAVSQKIKLHLAHMPAPAAAAAAGIPKKLLLSLQGHHGPVNTVQWCPVPQRSHLLLSASMDKTFKVWDGAESGRCLKVYTCHSGAVRDARWSPCGRQLLTGSFDNTAVVTDVETGHPIVKADNQFKLMCVVLHPSNPEVFLCGGYSSVVNAWDSRCCKVVKVYKAAIQQTLDILFLRGGLDVITSSDCVSRDSADRTLIAWDFHTTAKVSNQIYHERYTCPSLALHPQGDSFVAQTNGDYVAVFSSQRPYRMNKRRRFEGHKFVVQETWSLSVLSMLLWASYLFRKHSCSIH